MQNMQQSIDWENVSTINYNPQVIPRKIRETIYIGKITDLINREEGLRDLTLVEPSLFSNV